MATAPSPGSRAARRALAVTVATTFAAAGLLSAPPAGAAPAPRADPLLWGPCEAEGTDGLECASLQVPRDHADPQGPSITVGVYRLDLPDDQPRPAKVLFVNPGGPGGETGSTVRSAAELWPAEVLAAYDVIGVDPRGLGASTHVSCLPTPEEEPAPLPLPDLRPFPADRLQARLSEAAAYTAACFERSPELVPFISSDQTARDMDAVREHLGVERASLLGYSYGTVLFAHYARLFPDHVDKLVLDSAIYGRDYGWEVYEDRAPAFEARLGVFAGWAAENSELFALGDSPAQVLATFDRLVAALQDPATAGALGVGPGDLQLLGTQAAFSSLNFPLLALVMSLVDQLLALEAPVEQSPAAAATLAQLHRLAALVPDDSSQATTAAVLCNDGNYPEATRTYERAARKAQRHYPRIGAVQVAPLPCATWPLEPTRPLPVSRTKLDVRPLVVQALGDAATPYATGVDLARRTGAGLLTVTGGDHTHFGNGYEPCVDAVVTDYLVAGALPAAGAVCEGAPLPDFGFGGLDPQDQLQALSAQAVSRAARAPRLER